MHVGSVVIAARPHSRRGGRQTRPVRPRPGESDEHVNEHRRRAARSIPHIIDVETAASPLQRGTLIPRTSPGRRDASTDAVLPRAGGHRKRRGAARRCGGPDRLICRHQVLLVASNTRCTHGALAPATARRAATYWPTAARTNSLSLRPRLGSNALCVGDGCSTRVTDRSSSPSPGRTLSAPGLDGEICKGEEFRKE